MGQGLIHYQLVDMMTNRFKYFRWTPRTARVSFIYMILVPSILGYFAYTTDVSTHTIPAQSSSWEEEGEIWKEMPKHLTLSHRLIGTQV